jgi:hypothetical protein
MDFLIWERLNGFRERRNDPKNKMGTIISDSSHLTARNRSIMQCQVTVITTGRSPVPELAFLRQVTEPKSFRSDLLPSDFQDVRATYLQELLSEN